MHDPRVVGIGEFLTGHAPTRLVTYGIGSCAGIALYDPGTRQGALGHCLLPRSSDNPGARRTPKFTDAAIEQMLEQLIKSGCDSAGLVAKLAGGAAMFDNLYREGQSGVGERNIEAARETLARFSIPIAAEDVGGTIGRTMLFDLTDGSVMIRTLSQHAQKL